MNKEDFKQVTEVRICVSDEEGSWSFPIKCPRWLLTILISLEKR